MWILAILIALTAPEAAPAEPHVDERVEYYEIEGTTREELGRDIERKQRRFGESRHVVALTEWKVGWSYGSGGTGECRVGAVETYARIVTTLPRWTDRDDAPDGLGVRWDRFLEALERHEKWHAELAVDAARAVGRALERLPPADDCAALDADVQAAAREVVDDFHRQEVGYDLRTAHGASEGVILP